MRAISGEQSVAATQAPSIEGVVDLHDVAGSLLSRTGIIPADSGSVLSIDPVRIGQVLNELVEGYVDPNDEKARVTRQVTGLLIGGGVEAVQAEFTDVSETWIVDQLDYFQTIVDAAVTGMGGEDEMRQAILDRLEAPPESATSRGNGNAPKSAPGRPRNRNLKAARPGLAPPDLSDFKGLSPSQIRLKLAQRRRELNQAFSGSTSTSTVLNAEAITAARELRRLERAVQHLLQSPRTETESSAGGSAYEGVLSAVIRARLDFNPFDDSVQQAIADPGRFDINLGNCTSTDPEAMFGNAGQQHKAIKVCAGCIVRRECLGSAVALKESGVWGGMAERERAMLIHMNPDFISQARAKYAPEQPATPKKSADTPPDILEA